MDPNRLTQRSQAALTEAQGLATRLGHTETDGDHLFLALLEQEGGLVPRLFQVASANVDLVTSGARRIVDRRPKVTGPGVQPGQVHVTQRLSQLLETADREAKRLNDD